jgi:hypothetical protein
VQKQKAYDGEFEFVVKSFSLKKNSICGKINIYTNISGMAV